MPRPRKYPPSWIDDEGFKPTAYKLLRELVVVYQTKEELVNYLTSVGIPLINTRIRQEIELWLLKNEFAEVNSKLASYSQPILPETQKPPVYDYDKFGLFISELKELLRKHGVTIGADWDGCMSVESLDWNIYKDTTIDNWDNMILKPEDENPTS
jgi:hypothetical protein